MFANLGLVNDMFQLEEEEVVDASDTILHKVRMWSDNVKGHMPQNLPDYILRLTVGVLAFGRARQADIFIREHALIYWIAEGGKTLRFHAGDCYMKSPSGAFQQHRGVPPDHDRVQMFLLHLEGIFRLLPRNTGRTTNELLAALKGLWEQANSCENDFLLECVDACLTFAADPPRGGKAQGKGEDGTQQLRKPLWRSRNRYPWSSPRTSSSTTCRSGVIRLELLKLRAATKIVVSGTMLPQKLRLYRFDVHLWNIATSVFPIALRAQSRNP